MNEKIENNDIESNDRGDIQTVSELGEDVVEILAQDRDAADEETQKNVELALEKRRGRIHHDLIFTLAQLDMPEEVAHSRWKDILKHKYWMSERLGRNVGVRVAALDFFYNVTHELKYVTMMDVYQYNQAKRDSITDWLTGLYLKQHFYSMLVQEIKRAERKNDFFSILFFDIDYFKIYNDTHGHLAGDTLLREMVEIISTLIRKYDIFARYGGEEFIILFPSTPKESCLNISEDIRKTVEDYPFSGAIAMPDQCITLSGGVAEFPTDGDDAQTLLAYSDQALYHSKNAGRNRISICPAG